MLQCKQYLTENKLVVILNGFRSCSTCDDFSHRYAVRRWGASLKDVVTNGEVSVSEVENK